MLPDSLCAPVFVRMVRPAQFTSTANQRPAGLTFSDSTYRSGTPLNDRCFCWIRVHEVPYHIRGLFSWQIRTYMVIRGC